MLLFKPAQWIALWIVIHLSATLVGDTLGPRCSFGPRVTGLKPEPSMNASGQMLYGSSFEGLDLSKASFDRCNLNRVRFVQCNLKNASFVRATLTGAVFIECDITDADFTDAAIGGIKGGTRRPALDAQQLKSTWSFKSKDLSNCFISAYCDSPGKPTKSSFDFRGFKLNGATFYGSDLTTSKLENAHIEDVRLSV